MPFPANQVICYFHAFISLLKAIYLAAIHIIVSTLSLRLNLGLNIHVIILACKVPSFQPHKLCPTAIKLQEEWQIPWTSYRIFAWFTHAFLSSFNNNYHQHAY